jgi:hypothetical protein
MKIGLDRKRAIPYLLTVLSQGCVPAAAAKSISSAEGACHGGFWSSFVFDVYMEQIGN